jgi:hypothetical protein
MNTGYSEQWHRTEAQWSREPEPAKTSCEAIRKVEELRQRIYNEGLRRKRVGFLDTGKI